MKLSTWLRKSAAQMKTVSTNWTGHHKRSIDAFRVDTMTAAETAEEIENVLADWLKFSEDVMPSCPAGADYLNALKEKTKKLTEDGE